MITLMAIFLIIFGKEEIKASVLLSGIFIDCVDIFTTIYFIGDK